MKINRERLVLMFFDVLIINLTIWLSFMIRFEGRIPVSYRNQWLYFAVLINPIRITSFYLFGLYNSLWCYSSLPEMIQIIKAVTVSSLLFILKDRVILTPTIPLYDHYISWMMNIRF